MPSLVFVDATGFAVTPLYETLFLVSPVIAALSHRSRKNLVSSLSRLSMMSTPSSRTSRSDWATSAAQRTSGFPEVSQGRHRRGTSPSAAPFARPFGPQLPGTRSLFFSAWSFARPSSMTLLPAAQAWATFSALSTLKQLEGAGLLTLGSSLPDFLMSPHRSAPLSGEPCRCSAHLVNPSQGERAGNPRALPQPILPLPPSPLRGSHLALSLSR